MGVSFYTGKGVKVFVAPLPDGVETEPIACTPTIGATAPIKGATTITLSAALPAGVFIPAQTYLNYVSSTGYEVLVQLNADAKAGDAALTTKPLPEPIAAASTAEYPLRLRARTSADLDR
jgi:hypothetical protein